MNNITINNGFLVKEKYITAQWLQGTLAADSKFQEIKYFASSKQDIMEILNLGISISLKAKNIIFIGIGGSTLGGKAMYNLIAHEPKNKIYFIDNLDKSTILSTLSKINIDESYFVAISKSGGTIETVSQVCYIINILKESGLNPSDRMSFLTKLSNDSPLKNIAHKFNINLINWNGDISGRFSAFASNTNLINAIVGHDVVNLCNSFIATLNNIDLYIDYINFSISSIVNNQISSSIVMSYSDKLTIFNEWYIQLWSESIGKNGHGTNPCSAIGTIDQHSKLQLFLDGKKDKIFTLIGVDKLNYENDINWKLFEGCGIEKFKNASIDKIFSACYKGTFDALCQSDLPVRKIRLDEINPFNISKIMSLMIIETVAACSYLLVDPYNQPEVEKSKIYIFNNI